MPATPPFRSIAARLVSQVIFVCVACAGVAIGIQGWQIWRDTQHANARRMGDIARQRMPLLAAALWDIEAQAVQRQVDEIALQPEVAGVRLVTAGGQSFVAGARVSPDPADMELDVPHPRAGGAALGHLAIDFDRGYANTQLVHGLLRSAVAVALVSVLIGVVLVRLLRRELSEPLRRIAEHARRIKPGVASGPLALERPAREWRDDIDLVADVFSTLDDEIVRYVD